MYQQTIMKNLKTLLQLTFVATIVCLTGASHAVAQNVDARLSAREAYVGMPVVLQISVRNANDYEAPTIPEIDGCEIRSAGTPSQSSQITIINGRRSESRSVTMQYLITPRRAGTFEIPSLKLEVNGKLQQTQPLRFVATKSETGDLLFVEIAGGEDRVYVGQPLDLKLKIWIKPFADREQRIQLSEANMWQMISQQTSWGSFADRLREMAENNQRPAGREVLRDNGEGQKRSYFLYEIEATAYPTRPGKIDASDVQIIVNYPTALGKSRDPFDDFFKDSPFGGRMNQMMDDDFFSSPFGRRLTVKSARPIVAEANVDSTEVLPVPTSGRPADYRGAVGRYNIVTRATPSEVNAGDPITLNIGIVGDGPMELVQAPPLSTLEALTADFKVTDQSLAGFVQDETKVFSTTIRPRREGITEIPAIPFSFFDPDAESFKTVYSEPISIQVNKSEMLALDNIVGNTRRNQPEEESSGAPGINEPNLNNHTSSSILASETPSGLATWWWVFVVAPPIAWLMTLIYANCERMAGWVPSFQSPRSRSLAKINRTDDPRELADVLVEFIFRRQGKRIDNAPAAIGMLRTSGLLMIANEMESFLSKCERSGSGWQNNETIADLQKEAAGYVNQLDREFALLRRQRVRRRNGRGSKSAKRESNPRSSIVRSTGKISSLILLGLSIWFASPSSSFASESVSDNAVNQAMQATPTGESSLTDQPTLPKLSLSDAQRETILQEAGAIYAQARSAVETDSAEASEGFTDAAAKYQMIVDSGVRNSKLFVNLGNAYLQAGELGRAIANYERARQLAPSDKQVLNNLKYAQAQVKGAESGSTAETVDFSWTSWSAIVQQVRWVNELLINYIGLPTMISLLALSSILFWGLLIVRSFATRSGVRFKVWRFAAPIFLILVLCLASVALAKTGQNQAASGIVVANHVDLLSGDGDQFPTLYSIETAQGQPVKVLAQRANWLQIETTTGQTGWTESKAVELVAR